MRCTLGALCENAWIEDDGNPSMIRIFGRINCGSFPHVHPLMFLVCTLAIPPATRGNHFGVHIDFIDSDAQVLHRVMENPHLAFGGSEDTGSFSFTTLLNNMIFPAEGDYQFMVYIDETLAYEVPLAIRLL